VTGDKAIRWATIGAVTVVAIVAGWVSYRHALHVVSEHGETGWLARAYPLTIDGLIVAASMVLLTAARQRVRAHWLAYGALTLGITATVAVNIAAGLTFGAAGAIIAAWPAPALVISFELLMIVVRSLAAAPPGDESANAAGGLSPALTQVARDAEEAARFALAASVAAGNPISQRQLIARFALTRTQAAKVRASVLAASNGHATEETQPETGDHDVRAQ